MNRPDPRTFATYCYYLAFASSGILTLTIILSLIPGSGVLRHIMWLALITSAMGVFLGVAARSDLKQQEVEESLNRKLKVGMRVNVIALIVMVAAAVLALIVNLSDITR